MVRPLSYFRVKDFDIPFAERAKARLAGLRGGYSTRIGAAIRHAGADLKRQITHRRLLLIVTDGEPSDVDVAERRYLVEDARHAVQELGHQGVDVFCVGLDSGGDSYLTQSSAVAMSCRSTASPPCPSGCRCSISGLRTDRFLLGGSSWPMTFRRASEYLVGGPSTEARQDWVRRNGGENARP